MKLNKIFIVAVVLIFAFSAKMQAQKSRFYEANALYDTMAFAEAIPKYQKVLKKDSTNAEAMLKLADCYRKLNDVHNAVKIYKEIIKKGFGTPIDKLFYAQALMATGNYEEAKKYMAEYNADLRGETFTKAMDDMNKFFKDSAYYNIEPVPFNSKLNDFSPRILDNKIVFASSRKRSYAENHINVWTNDGFFKLYYTKKKDDGNYSRVRHFAYSLDNRYNDGPVSFGHNNKTIYLSRNNIVNTKLVRAKDGQVKMQIYAATLNKKGTAYKYLLDFKYNNIDYHFMHPAISDDGTRLYFVSDMPGGIGGTDLWMCEKENGKWSEPKNLGKAINTEGNEAFPYLAGSVLYFSSNGLEGIGGMDIFKIALDEKGVPASKPYNLGVPMNSSGDDFGIVFNDLGNQGYFSSNRKALNIDDDIYAYTFNKREILISGVTSELVSKDLMTEVNVALVNEKNEVIGEVNSNENGNFMFFATPNQEYTIKGAKNLYLNTEKKVLTAVDEQTTVVNTGLELEKDPKISLFIEVTDSKTKKILKGVNVEITDNINGKTYQFDLSPSGEHSDILSDKRLDDRLHYSVKLRKDGYFNSTSNYTFNIKEKGMILKMEQSMDQILTFEPVYFDYNKFDIRPDASDKLNALTEMMKENPSWYIELYSFTDCRGTESYNMELSVKRANSTAQYLIDFGIAKKRIVGKGMGISKNVADCNCKTGPESNCTEEQYQLNRRTEFKLIRK